MPTLERFLAEQATHGQCTETARSLGQSSYHYQLKHDEILVRQSVIDGSLQRFVLTSLHKRIMYLAHYARLTAPSWERGMNDRLRKHYYWRHMGNDIFTTVRLCQSCWKEAAETRPQRKLQLFSPAGPLEFLEMHILGPLPKTVSENQFVVLITDHH